MKIMHLCIKVCIVVCLSGCATSNYVFEATEGNCTASATAKLRPKDLKGEVRFEFKDCGITLFVGEGAMTTDDPLAEMVSSTFPLMLCALNPLICMPPPQGNVP